MAINAFYPLPDKSVTNSTLYKLAGENMLKEINDTIGGTIQDKFDSIAANDTIVNTFGGDTYNYAFGKYSAKFNSSMSKATLNSSKGNTIGYDMALVGPSSTRRSTFQPPSEERASFITLELVQNLFEYQATTTEWQKMRVDSTVLISDMFQFYLIDLESIIPDALDKYPNLLSKLYATCGIQGDAWDVKFDTQYQLVKVTASWDCTLKMQDGDDTLLGTKQCYLGVTVPLAYETQISQVGKSLRVYISNAMLNGDAVWTEQPDLPIKNAKLANLYLKSLLGPLSGRQTLGTGFPCFTTASKPYVTGDNVIKLK